MTTHAADADPISGHPGLHTVMAGIVCGLVGFTSSFAVVLTGLHAVGASQTQAASGLLALCVTMGLGCLLFSWRTRMPITMAWSTPGAALLASAAVPVGGFSAAVGAFVVCGVMLALTGMMRPLGRLVDRIPGPLALAMLAGVLLHLVVAPVTALVADPWAIAPVVLTWVLLTAIAKRWAVIGALVAAFVVMLTRGVFTHLDPTHLAPHVEFVAPRLDAGALVAITLPLFIVTMTSQNIPGIAVLGSFGYRVRMREPLLYSGAASAVSALAGGHAINLAAISAALAAGPEAGPDHDRRWIAGVSCGVTYLAFAPLVGVVVAVATAAPPGIVETIAGLALLATFASSMYAALADPTVREPAAMAIVAAASGIIAGIGAAFWGLLAGLVLHAVLTRR